ncbi:hypothetical protein [Thalassospira profundimaris]|uniref:Uncharacterized protein n=1 Tax=Thalassospira profundimaris TaxID=502049 RepID=A0A367WPD3_9PROT|nr:hypothetical protein [Thalassospira profundimaris]RCK43238.1 hypothetical protein TH30_19680 [Thalassospira profundimaris]
MTADKTKPAQEPNISEEELLALGLILNDGAERGWLRTLAFLLKKNPSVVSKWKKEIHRVSKDDVQHMRLLVLLKEAGVLQSTLIASRLPVTLKPKQADEKGRGVRKSVRDEIAQALGRER